MQQSYFDLWERSFAKFLSHTNEKAVLLRELSGYLERYKPKSLLDIGAGNGSLAIPIASKVDNYTAVERNPKYAAHLKSAGLVVIEASFPAKVTGSYDMVLLSHVISYETRNHIALITNAWELVARNGHLLVVTHRGEDDDWSQLLDSIGMGKLGEYQPIYADIVSALKTRGETETQTIVTTLETTSLQDMIEAMAFVASAGYHDAFNKFMSSYDSIKSLLDKKYKTQAGYSFPFTHIFMSTSKN